MRRALLTAAKAGGNTVGNTGAFGTAAWPYNGVMLDIAHPAGSTGTIRSVKVRGGVQGTVRVMVGSLSGMAFTVRSITGEIGIPGSSNETTFLVNLPVQAGDYIGVWSNPNSGTAGGRLNYTSSVGNTGYMLNVPTTAPIAGQVLTLGGSQTGNDPNIFGSLSTSGLTVFGNIDSAMETPTASLNGFTSGYVLIPDYSSPYAGTVTRIVTRLSASNAFAGVFTTKGPGVTNGYDTIHAGTGQGLQIIATADKLVTITGLSLPILAGGQIGLHFTSSIGMYRGFQPGGFYYRSSAYSAGYSNGTRIGSMSYTSGIDPIVQVTVQT